MNAVEFTETPLNVRTTRTWRTFVLLTAGKRSRSSPGQVIHQLQLGGAPPASRCSMQPISGEPLTPSSISISSPCQTAAVLVRWEGQGHPPTQRKPGTLLETGERTDIERGGEDGENRAFRTPMPR